MNEITPTETRTNRGRFKPGPDSRRHRFSREECQAGFWAALTSIITRFPTAIDQNGRHMSCRFLTTKGGRDR
jgi:hypothetical protein